MIQVGDKEIGQGKPCFVAAEIGINHNGDINLAKQTIKAAKHAGASAVKFQNYCTEDLVLNKTLTHSYEVRGKAITETQHDMFKRCELSDEQFTELKKYCDELGIIFFSTPTSVRRMQVLQKLQVPLLKNSSSLLNHFDLVQAMARSGIPSILSLGMATLEEIKEVVKVFEDAGGKDLILLHCVSLYPCPDDALNLRRINTLMNTFEYPIGFSDHSIGELAAVNAVTLGGCFIEKHFTLDKQLDGPDHSFSANPEELQRLVSAIRITEAQLGDSKIAPIDKEQYARDHYRLSCVANKDLPTGHTLNEDDIAFSRPATGLPPKSKHLLINKVLKQAVKKHQPLVLDIVQ